MRSRWDHEEDEHFLHLRFSFPQGHPLHCRQSAFLLLWGQPLQAASRHKLFNFPCSQHLSGLQAEHWCLSMPWGQGLQITQLSFRRQCGHDSRFRLPAMVRARVVAPRGGSRAEDCAELYGLFQKNTKKNSRTRRNVDKKATTPLRANESSWRRVGRWQTERARRRTGNDRRV